MRGQDLGRKQEGVGERPVEYEELGLGDTQRCVLKIWPEDPRPTWKQSRREEMGTQQGMEGSRVRRIGLDSGK